MSKQNKNNKKQKAHSGYINEPRLKRKREKVSNDSSENETRKRQKDHQVKKKPEKSHLSNKRRIPEQPEFVIDRISSSFAQDFHHCEDRSKYQNSATAMNPDFKYKDGIEIEGVLYTYAPLLFDTGIFEIEDCTGLSNCELSDTTDESDDDYERKNLRNEARTSARDDRNYRSDHERRNLRNEARTSARDNRNYRSDHERRNLRNEARTSPRDDRNYRSDHVPDKKNKHYNKNQHNRYDGSSKQNWYQSPESSRKLQHQRDKNKRYFSSDTKHHNKHQSNSSSTNSEHMNDNWNKPRSSNTEASALWHSERLKEDKNKRERCIKWVEDSMHGCNSEEEKIPADEEEKANTNPKRKLEKFETTSDKCLNDNDVHSVGSSSRNKPKQSCNLKSRKLDSTDNKSSTKVAQKAQVLRKSYTKFDRINRSDHSSDDSDSNYNLESNKQDYTENDNSNIEKEHFKCNMKYENEPSEEKSEESSPEEIEKPSNSERNFTESKSESQSPSYNPGSQFVKRSSDNQRYSPVRKVYSHNDGYVISREFTCSDRGCNEKDFKKGSKAKRNPQTNLQYNSPESCKNEHISKQRKFDKGQSKEALNNQRCKWNRQYFVSSGNKNRSMKAEKCTSDKKRSDFNVVQSLNQDDGDWGNIVQSQVEDGWGNTTQSQVDDDDGIWASADQSDIKWEINEDCNTKQKSPEKISGGHDKKEAKAFKGKDPIGSDEGGWSTVEEGEIRSDDGF